MPHSSLFMRQHLENSRFSIGLPDSCSFSVLAAAKIGANSLQKKRWSRRKSLHVYLDIFFPPCSFCYRVCGKWPGGQGIRISLNNPNFINDLNFGLAIAHLSISFKNPRHRTLKNRYYPQYIFFKQKTLSFSINSYLKNNYKGLIIFTNVRCYVKRY